VRDIRRREGKLEFLLRWEDRRADGGQYRDSWVKEECVPNKITLFQWLNLHGPLDSVIALWMDEITEREDELVLSNSIAID
jgi:hypothetical protein